MEPEELFAYVVGFVLVVLGVIGFFHSWWLLSEIRVQLVEVSRWLKKMDGGFPTYLTEAPGKSPAASSPPKIP